MYTFSKTAACLCAVLMASAAMPVISAAAADTPAQPAASAQSETKQKSGNCKTGKVTAVNGDQITITVGSHSAKKHRTSDTADTAQADSTQTAETTKSRKGSAKNGNSDTAAETAAPLTVTLGSGVTIEKDGETITAADISVGDVLRLKYDDNGTLVKVKVSQKSRRSETRKSRKSAVQSAQTAQTVQTAQA
ncbi:MAG: hypothetical protein K6F80_03820 [Oscillospiraceae bacterium]|nr:hypothetical protein [Oscillospiraceae bacterium]